MPVATSVAALALVYFTSEPLATKVPLDFENAVPEPDKITAVLLKLALAYALSVRAFDIVVVAVQPPAVQVESF